MNRSAQKYFFLLRRGGFFFPFFLPDLYRPRGVNDSAEKT